jgi:hypothetical protein
MLCLSFEILNNQKIFRFWNGVCFRLHTREGRDILFWVPYKELTSNSGTSLSKGPNSVSLSSQFSEMICFHFNVTGRKHHLCWVTVSSSCSGIQGNRCIPFTWKRKRNQSPKHWIIVLSTCLEFRTINKVHKPGGSEFYSQSSKPQKFSNVGILAAVLLGAR